jgi:hypothetical protein
LVERRLAKSSAMLFLLAGFTAILLGITYIERIPFKPLLRRNTSGALASPFRGNRKPIKLGLITGLSLYTASAELARG